MMQKVRGYLCFSKKEKRDVDYVFKNFRWDEVKFKIFGFYEYNNRTISDPGVFFVGWINKKYTSENIIRLLKRLMAVDVSAMRYSVSLENENTIDFQDNFLETKGRYCCLFFKERPKQKELNNISTIINNGNTNNLSIRDGVGYKHEDFAIDFFVDEKTQFVELVNEIKKNKIDIANTMLI